MTKFIYNHDSGYSNGWLEMLRILENLHLRKYSYNKFYKKYLKFITIPLMMLHLSKIKGIVECFDLQQACFKRVIYQNFVCHLPAVSCKTRVPRHGAPKLHDLIGYYCV